MKKEIIAIAIISMFLLTSISVLAVVVENQGNGEQIILSYSFETPVTKKVEIGGSIYDRVTIEDAPCCGNPGEPSLPARGAYILIPQGRTVSSITADPGEMICLGSRFMVEPVAECVPLSKISTAPIPKPDVEIYSSSDMFPGKFFTEIGTYSFRGYEILVLRLHPVQYIPASGELFYYPDLTVSVKTIEDSVVNPLFRGLEKDKLEIVKKVDNPSTADTYEYQSMKTLDVGALGESYDMVIITDESLKTGFEPLKQVHDSDGLKTLIYTVEDIYNEYSGVDEAEKIRNFVIDAYNNWGIEYVLLGGDHDIVPARILFAVTPKATVGWIPSDLYYSCLDGRWQNPENPIPASKDVSFNDPGVSFSTTGFLSGPEADYSDYMMGDSSLKWTVTNTKHSACCKFTFDPPLDLSDMYFLELYGKEKTSIEYGYTFQPIIFHSVDGDQFLYSMYWPNFRSTWHNHCDVISTSDDFNWNAVDSITFKIYNAYGCSPEIGDNIWIDGFHFGEYKDEYWGEPGEDDLYAEVYVGRACVDNAADVNNFVSKTIEYMDTGSKDGYLNKVLMAGEHLGFGGEGDWGGNHLDELIGGTSKHGYTTIGFPTSKYSIKKLYDRDRLSELGWLPFELINRINKNIHIINHDGHSDYRANMKLVTADISLLKNDKYSFIYSTGCMAGAFDDPEGYDCIAEHFTVKTSHVAFAGIWNARYGFGAINSTDGPSQRFIREFWDAVFSENIKVIGKANQDSKEDNIWRIDEDYTSYMRWVYYELNLFGDPAVAFINYNDNQPNKPTIDGPKSGKPGIEYEYTFVTTDPNGDDVYYYIDWGDDAVDDWFGPCTSGETATASHIWNAQGTYAVRAKAKNTDGAESDWGTLEVIMPRNKAINNPFLKFLQNHPILFQLLQRFLKL